MHTSVKEEIPLVEKNSTTRGFYVWGESKIRYLPFFIENRERTLSGWKRAWYVMGGSGFRAAVYMHTDLCATLKSRANINVTSYKSTGNFMGRNIFTIFTQKKQLRLAVRCMGSEIIQLRFWSPFFSLFSTASCKNYHKLIMLLDIHFICKMEFYKLRSN